VSDKKIITYQYDAFDRKVAKHVDNDADLDFDTSDFYVYDGDDVLWDFVDAGLAFGEPFNYPQLLP
jgi:hypothetical protein